MTPAQARDDIYTLFKAAWDAGTTSAGLPLLYDNVKGDPPTTKDANGWPTSWGRIAVRHASGGQSTLGPNAIFSRIGNVFVQIFTPLGAGFDGGGDDLADDVLSAFEGQTTALGAWFRNGRLIDVGPSTLWFQQNVITEFTYDQRR